MVYMNHRNTKGNAMKTIDDTLRDAVNALPVKNAENAAKAVHAALVALATEAGYNTKYVFLRAPGERRHTPNSDCWQVCWEEGPYEWAIPASMAIGDAGILAEPYYSFDLDFYDN